MVDKLYGKMDSIQEINRMAANLRRIGLSEKIMELAQKYKVPKEEAEEYLQRKRYFLIDGGDTPKTYDTARSKLVDEMLQLKDPLFGDVIGNYLVQSCMDDACSALILQAHKTLQRCIEYVMEQAYGMVSEEEKKQNKNLAVAVTDDVVFHWILDYYALDDKEKLAQSAKESEEAFKKRMEEKPIPIVQKKAKKSSKRSQTKQDSQKSQGEHTQGEAEKKGSGLSGAKAAEREKNQVDGQVSLFDTGLPA